MKSTESIIQLKIHSDRAGPRPLSDALVAELRRRVVSRFYDQRYVADAIAHALVHGNKGTGDKGQGTGATD
ncbi:MAG TPA: hypothetical protein VFT29_06890 [Gemmatimonadaceae bacterium]|nr:hypothetical protein [Gemmatimonadaceae bacterium]